MGGRRSVVSPLFALTLHPVSDLFYYRGVQCKEFINGPSDHICTVLTVHLEYLLYFVPQVSAGLMVARGVPAHGYSYTQDPPRVL